MTSKNLTSTTHETIRGWNPHVWSQKKFHLDHNKASMMSQYQRKRVQRNIGCPRLCAPVSSTHRLVGEQVHCVYESGPYKYVSLGLFPLGKCPLRTYACSIVLVVGVTQFGTSTCHFSPSASEPCCWCRVLALFCLCHLIRYFSLGPLALDEECLNTLFILFRPIFIAQLLV